MHPGLQLGYLALAAFAVLYGLFRFQETRRRRAVVGAALAAVTSVLLLLPEGWVVDLVVRGGWGSSAAGAWLASLLHRPSPLAAGTYGALLLVAYAVIALVRGPRASGRGERGRR